MDSPRRSLLDAYNRALVAVIRDEIESSPLTYKEIAARAGITEVTLSRMLTTNPDARSAPIRASQLHYIAKALGTTSGELADRAARRLEQGRNGNPAL